MADDDLKPGSSPSDEEFEDDGQDDLENEEFEEDGVTPKKPGKKSAEARIQELNAKLKAIEEKNAELEKKVTTPPPPPQAPTKEGQLTADQVKAVEYLESLGFTRKEAVDSKIKEIEDRRALDSEHGRLVSTYDGSDGRPKYDQSKVEQFMRDHAVYDPEIAYKAMNEAELLDWTMKKSNTGDQKQRPFIEKPGGAGVNRSGQNAITREKLAEVSQNPTPANRDWYERNRNKILQLLAEGQL